MLFYHTGHVIDKQTRKASNLTINSDGDGNSDGDDDM